MRLDQDSLPFRPITLTIETREEARALALLAGRVCGCVESEGSEIASGDITDHEHKLAIAISDAFSTGAVSA